MNGEQFAYVIWVTKVFPFSHESWVLDRWLFNKQAMQMLIHTWGNKDVLPPSGVIFTGEYRG